MSVVFNSGDGDGCLAGRQSSEHDSRVLGRVVEVAAGDIGAGASQRVVAAPCRSTRKRQCRGELLAVVGLTAQRQQQRPRRTLSNRSDITGPGKRDRRGVVVSDFHLSNIRVTDHITSTGQQTHAELVVSLISAVSGCGEADRHRRRVRRNHDQSIVDASGAAVIRAGVGDQATNGDAVGGCGVGGDGVGGVGAFGDCRAGGDGQRRVVSHFEHW